MDKFNVEDFKISNQRKSQDGQNFCGSCDQPVQSSDCDSDGYTNCCNEPAISRYNWIYYGKAQDVDNLVGPLGFYTYYEDRKPFRFFVKSRETDKKFALSLKNDVDSIVSTLNIYLN